MQLPHLLCRIVLAFPSLWEQFQAQSSAIFLPRLYCYPGDLTISLVFPARLPEDMYYEIRFSSTCPFNSFSHRLFNLFLSLWLHFSDVLILSLLAHTPPGILAPWLVMRTWWEGLKQAQDQLVPLLVSLGHEGSSPFGNTLPLPPPTTTTTTTTTTTAKWPGSSGNLSYLCQALLSSSPIFLSSHPTSAGGGLARPSAPRRYLPGPWLALGWHCCVSVSPCWWQVVYRVVCGRKKSTTKQLFSDHLWTLAPCTFPSWAALLHQSRTQPVSVSPGFPMCLLLLSQIHQLSLFFKQRTELGFRKRG